MILKAGWKRGWALGWGRVEGGSEVSEMDKIVQLFCFKRLRSFKSSEGLVQINVETSNGLLFVESQSGRASAVVSCVSVSLWRLTL